jgi:hypothetical protein
MQRIKAVAVTPIQQCKRIRAAVQVPDDLSDELAGVPRGGAVEIAEYLSRRPALVGWVHGLADAEFAAFCRALDVDPGSLRSALSGDAATTNSKAPQRAQPRPAPTLSGGFDLRQERATLMANAHRASIEASVRRAEAAERGVLLESQGHRLEPSVRTWAATQPVAVVRALVAAAPKASSRQVPRGGLEGRDLEAVRMAMGTHKPPAGRVYTNTRGERVTAAEPHLNEHGDLVIPATTPTEYRRIVADRARRGGGR